MATLLVVDDDDAVRRMIKLNLADGYEIFDTSEPEQALALALEHKPDAILLDLRMPKYSGFQLCQTFATFNATQLTPIVVISGEAGARTKELCRDLGAKAYFEKPVDFDSLRARLSELLEGDRKERRSEVRVRLRVAVRLKGVNRTGQRIDVVTRTENVGRRSFLCACAAALLDGSPADVYLRPAGGADEYAGNAEIIRSEWNDTHYPRYACRFKETPESWVLQ
jgi:twitching motility two-component system response regulator PilG